MIAHEVGHHVQNLIGTAERVTPRAARSEADGNQLSVRLELQADCYAGVWAHYVAARRLNRLDPGDIEEGLGRRPRSATTACSGPSQGRVVPDTFTHGSSEQRVRWLRAASNRATRTTATRSAPDRRPPPR